MTTETGYRRGTFVKLALLGFLAGLFMLPLASTSAADEQAKLTAGDVTAYDTFGKTVSISGDTAVVGAPYDDDKGGESGSAYVLVRSGERFGC